MADSADAGDFLKMGADLVLEGSSSSVTAKSGTFSDSLLVSGTDLVEFLRDRPLGLIGRANRTSAIDFTGGQTPHSDFGSYNSGAPFLQLDIDDMKAGRQYRLTANLRIYNTNANTTFVDAMVGYTYSATTVPTNPNHTSSIASAAGPDDVIMKRTFGKQGSQNTTFGTLTRIWVPPADGNYRFLIFGGSDVTTPGGTVKFDPVASMPNQFYVEDLGVLVPSTGIIRTTGADADTRKVTKTVTFEPQWAGYYASDGSVISYSSGQETGYLGGYFSDYYGRKLYYVFDPPLNATDTNAIYYQSGSTTDITKVEAEVYYSGPDSSADLQFYYATGGLSASPYLTYGSIPGVVNTTDTLVKRGSTWVTLGANDLWADPTSARLLGVGVYGYPGYSSSDYFVSIERIRITYTVVE
jgi:hypothetical protein